MRITEMVTNLIEATESANPAPLVVVLVFQAIVLGALVNSVVQFTVHQKNQRRRLAAVVSSLTLLLILSIYYARTLGRTLQRLAESRTGGGRVDDSPLFKAGRWLKGSYFEWWIEHLPTLITRPAPFRETMGPVMAVAGAYVVRAGIYRFYRHDYPKRQAFASAYWVHITLYFVFIAFLRRVYGFDGTGIAIFTGISLLLMIGGIATIAGDIAGGTLLIAILLKKAAVLTWKWGTVAATAFADFVRMLRREFGELYVKFVRDPFQRFFAGVEDLIDRSDASAERKMAAGEAREEERDHPRDPQPPSDGMPPPTAPLGRAA